MEAKRLDTIIALERLQIESPYRAIPVRLSWPN